MDTSAPQADLHLPPTDGSSLSRRGFLRGAALTGGGLIAAGIAACAPTSQAGCAEEGARRRDREGHHQLRY